MHGNLTIIIFIWKNLLQLFSYSLKKTIYLGNTYYTHIQHDILLHGFRAIFTRVSIVLEIRRKNKGQLNKRTNEQLAKLKLALYYLVMILLFSKTLE